MRYPLPRESSGLHTVVSPIQGPVSEDDKHLVLQGKALKVRGDAVDLRLVHC